MFIGGLTVKNNLLSPIIDVVLQFSEDPTCNLKVLQLGGNPSVSNSNKGPNNTIHNDEDIFRLSNRHSGRVGHSSLHLFPFFIQSFINICRVMLAMDPQSAFSVDSISTVGPNQGRACGLTLNVLFGKISFGERSGDW